MVGVEKFVSSQPQYSLLWREPEAKVFPLCRSNGISQIVWSPLAQGVLSGKYLPGAAVPNGSRAASATMGSMFNKAFLSRPVLEAVQQIKPLAETAGLTLAQFALREAISHALGVGEGGLTERAVRGRSFSG